MVYSSMTLCVKHVIRFGARGQSQRSNHICSVIFQPSFSVSSMPALRANSNHMFVGCQALHWSCFGSGISTHKSNCNSLLCKSTMSGSLKARFDLSRGWRNMSLQTSSSVRTGMQRWNYKAATWLLVGLVCYSSSESVHADAPGPKDGGDQCDPACVSFSHGKKVYTDYSVIGIPGDGRCLFRSVAHGACIRAGRPPPPESLQRELADELRASVANEFVKRRQETEWFIEGNFETYIEQMRRPHVWGGEPELLMASHVLKMPITVYMHDKDAGGLIAIAEYGQEYGKDNPVNVLYHGFGHYDALQIPGKDSPRPRI